MERLQLITEIFYSTETLILWLNITLKEKQEFLNTTVIGDENTLVFAPTPDATYTIQINYILKNSGVIVYKYNYIPKSKISQWLIVCMPGRGLWFLKGTH